ncbi:MAG: hypothetical protein HYZ29_26915 [Myxococcales bacterium]|nr:hypothetical protein [Myxococcales bacterium]
MKRIVVSGGLALVLSVGCGDDGGGGQAAAGGAGGVGGGGASGGSAGAAGDASVGGSAGSVSDASDGGGCVRTPGPADGPRKVIVALPYDADQKKSDLYQVLDLDADGQLAKTGKTFLLGRATNGEIVFTPDGKLGFVATEAGKVGAFRIEPNGDVSVIDAGFGAAFNASKLVVDPKGDRLYVIDSEWRDVGGGIYSVRIGCDDQLTDEGLVAAAKLPAGLVLSVKTPGRAFVAADDILTSPAARHLHVLDWSATPKHLSSTVAFGQDSPIVSSLALTLDESHALIADNSGFSSVPNRVAVVKVDGTGLTALQELTPIEDPADIEVSPFDKTALVTSGFGDAIHVLSFDPAKPAAPYSAKKLSYQGGAPQLPIDMAQIRRGKLTGRVLVSEVSGVRQVAFASGAAPTDLGVFALGTGTESVPGAIGVQP